MFVIKNKLSLSDRRGKSMHYPESPKVTILLLVGSFLHQKFVLNITVTINCYNASLSCVCEALMIPLLWLDSCMQRPVMVF